MPAYPVLGIETKADHRLAKIPLAVRMKLDLAGCKISLDHWQMLDQEQRRTLFAMSAETGADIDAFGTALVEALAGAGCPPPTSLPPRALEWKEAGPVPPTVEEMLRTENVDLEWSALGRFGRYVICSLAHKADRERLRRAAAELAVRSA